MKHNLDLKINKIKISDVIVRLSRLLQLDLPRSYLRKSVFCLSKGQQWSLQYGKHGIALFKERCEYMSRWVLSSNREPDRNHPLWKLNRRGSHWVPKGFHWAFIGFKSKRHLLFVLTLLSYHRVLRSKPRWSLSSITDHPPSYLMIFITSLRLFKSPLWTNYPLRKLRLSFRYSPKFTTSVKSGPNGPRSWKWVEEDYIALKESWAGMWVFLLFRKLSRFGDVKSCTRLVHLYMDTRDSVRSKGRDQFRKKLVHSKLSILSDKSGKSRIVAIGDSWTQSILRPLHDHLFKIIRRLNHTDGTFDQDKQRKRVQRWTKRNKGKVYSLDLSSATDRLPIFTQALVLKRMIPEFSVSIICLWVFVMVGRKFLYRRNVGKHNVDKFVSYRIGQPMGFYSSWAMLALTHHCIVWYASYQAGYTKDYFRHYAILGDDIVISSETVAREYKKIISNLGVSISLHKSYESSSTSEFAKSIFVDGFDVSPFSWEILFLRRDYYFQDASILLQDLYNRNIKVPLDIFVDSWSRQIGNKHRLLCFITCPYLPVYYDHPIFQGWDKYACGYIHFRRLERGYLRLTFEDVAGSFVVSDDKMPNSDVSPWKTPGYEMLEELEDYPFLETFEGSQSVRIFDLGNGFVMCSLGLIEFEEPAPSSWNLKSYGFPSRIFSRKPPVLKDYDPKDSRDERRKTLPKLEILRLAEIFYDHNMTSLVYKYHSMEGGCMRVRN